jgi:predicted MPP superfamily phosphohydrolase
MCVGLSAVLGALAAARPAAAITAMNASDPTPAPSHTLHGVVFEDANRNGRRDAGEAGIAGVAVSDQHGVAVTGADGRYELTLAADARLAFVSVPDGYTAKRRWVPFEADTADVDFALERRAKTSTFTFLHASDTHLDEKSLPRMRRLREIVEKEKPDFVILTGDLVRDALRVPEAKAQGYYDMVVAELARLPVPVFTVPGNHEMFGIERHLSLVSPANPLYGRAMYRRMLGPDSYSFEWGGLHFVGLDTVDIEDLWYYGHVDKEQLAWLEKDLARVPAATPVVTFNHIPLATSIDALSGYTEDGPAPSLIRIDGHMQYRHVVSNTGDVLAKIAPHRLEIALGGHMHVRETIAFETTLGRVRFYQTAAVVGPSDATGLSFVSGVTLYRVRDGHVDDGTFLPLDAAAR